MQNIISSGYLRGFEYQAQIWVTKWLLKIEFQQLVFMYLPVWTIDMVIRTSFGHWLLNHKTHMDKEGVNFFVSSLNTGDKFW